MHQNSTSLLYIPKARTNYDKLNKRFKGPNIKNSSNYQNLLFNLRKSLNEENILTTLLMF